MDYEKLAEQALERRHAIWQRAHDERRALTQDERDEMTSLEQEARDYLDDETRAAETARAVSRSGALGNAQKRGGTMTPDDEWRGLLPNKGELRAMSEGVATEGGYTVPSKTATKYVDMLRNKAVFLKGIPAENVVRFDSQKFTLPVLSDDGMPALVAENAAIPEGNGTWAGLEFDAKKYADLRKASNEILADSALNLRNVLGQTMTKNTAAQFDVDAFSGDGTTTPILGILGQGTSTEVGSTAGDLPTWDDVADAVGRLWAADAEPTVIWAAPDAATALGKERVGTAGERLEPNSPLNVARSLPTLVSTSLPAGNVVVADGSRVFAGIRHDVRLAISEHFAFDQDQVAFRLTMRAAGLYVVESTSVQVLTANDGV